MLNELLPRGVPCGGTACPEPELQRGGSAPHTQAQRLRTQERFIAALTEIGGALRRAPSIEREALLTVCHVPRCALRVPRASDDACAHAIDGSGGTDSAARGALRRRWRRAVPADRAEATRAVGALRDLGRCAPSLVQRPGTVARGVVSARRTARARRALRAAARCLVSQGCRRGRGCSPVPRRACSAPTSARPSWCTRRRCT